MSTKGNDKIAKNTISLYLRMALVMVISLYTSRVILNTLGIEDYGIYNVVAGFVSMFAFLNTSLTACIQRYYNYEGGIDGEIGFTKVYITSVFIQIALAIVVLLLTESFGVWYLNHKLVIPDNRINAAQILFHCSVCSMVIVILQVPYSAAIIAKEHMGYYAIVGIIDIILKLGIVVILPYTKGDYLVLYGVFLFCVNVIDFFLYFVFFKRRFTTIKFRLTYHQTLFKEMMGFSGWSIFGSFAQIIRNQGINIILNLFFGPVVNAARGISFQVKTALSSFMANIPTAARPQLVESYAVGDYSRSKNIMFTISKICFLLLYILAIPIIGEMNYVLHLWLGNNVPENTVIFSRIILVISLVETLNWPTSMMIYATGKIGMYNILTGLVGILVLPFSYIVLRLGCKPSLVYFVSLVISIVVQAVSMLCLQKVANISIKEYLNKVIKPCILVVILSFFIPIILNLCMKESFLRLLVDCLVSISIIGCFSYRMGLSKDEKSIVNQYIKTIKNRMIKK